MKKCVIPVLTALAVTSMSAVMALAPETVICEPPDVDLAEIEGYVSIPVETSEAELKILPSDTAIVKRLYRAGGREFLVSLVIGGKSKSSIHRPELCLPSQGFLMSSPKTREISGVEWRTLFLDGSRGAARAGFAYTFFNQAGFRTASHLKRIFADVWDRSVNNRVDRWVMVTVYASDPDALGGFLAELAEVIK